MVDDEIVKVLRACGNGNTACEKCPFYIGEDSSECRFNAIYESADLIESLQTQIGASKRREKAAVEDMLIASDSGRCAVCKHMQNVDICQKWPNRSCFEWRGA